jgi:hypothetical protein
LQLAEQQRLFQYYRRASGRQPSYPPEPQPEVAIYKQLSVHLQQLGERMDLGFSALAKTVASTAQREGEETRRHVSDESRLTRQELGHAITACEATILDCFKYNAAKNVKLLATAGAFVFAASLAVSATTGIHLVHPLFALLCLIGCGGFYLMAKADQAAR